ncbi:MAG TPA: metalloprotease family protein [archaeon]|nr:metalloprotease family protein [archaeon]
MFIPGIIISILTFPGVIFHEWGHKFFCDRTGVKVSEVKYFRFGNPAGYVLHEPATTFKQSFFITVGPFITGTVFTLIFFLLSRIFRNSPIEMLLIWLGGSIAMNCFPSGHDAKALWLETGRHAKTNSLALIGYPFAAIIWIADKLRIIWFDLIYAAILYGLVKVII